MTKPNKTYLIKLTPVNKYFFGGERTLGANNEENYFVQSRYLPQQTTLLGTMRYRLLVDNVFGGRENVSGKGLDSEVEEYIGAHSFDHKKGRNYGCIQQLSTLFILATEENKIRRHYHSAALNRGYELERMPPAKAILDTCTIKENFVVTDLSVAVQLKGYDPKKELTPAFIAANGHCLRYEDIFEAHTQIGIKKSPYGNTEDRAFFKQTYYRLKQQEEDKEKNKKKTSYAFAFYLNLSPDAQGNYPKLNSGLVQMGGERSLFKMEIEEQTIPATILPVLALPTDAYEKLILLSDAYLPATIHQYCDFSIVRTIPFRYLQTSVKETKNYFALGGKNQTKKSVSFQLIQRGSVFYIKKGCREAFIKAIEQETAFRNIGYNQYFIHPKNN